MANRLRVVSNFGDGDCGAKLETTRSLYGEKQIFHTQHVRPHQ